MKIIVSKQFKKHAKKLSVKVRRRIADATDIFERDPHDQRLQNHALHGEMNGLRSISAAPDIRIVFKQYDNYMIVLFVDVGTHSQLYD